MIMFNVLTVNNLLVLNVYLDKNNSFLISFYVKTDYF
jgi:hypothetical protein